MPKSPAISIVIPLYNTEAYIAECLHSIFAQDLHEEMELIVVDDRSSDQSAERARECFRDAPPNIHCSLIIKGADEVKGASASRNKGMDLLQGRYVFFVDSDDILTPHALQALYQEAEKEQLDLCLGRWYLYYKDEETGGEPLLKKDDFWKAPACHGESGYSFAEHLCQSLIRRSACAVLYRRSFLQEKGLRFINGIELEDAVWPLHLSVAQPRFSILDDVLYYYRQNRKGSVMYTYSNKRLFSYAAITKEGLRLIREHRGTAVERDIRLYFSRCLRWFYTDDIPRSELGLRGFYKLAGVFADISNRDLREICALITRLYLRPLHIILGLRPRFLRQLLLFLHMEGARLLWGKRSFLRSFYRIVKH